jgi:hypothetical protein
MRWFPVTSAANYNPEKLEEDFPYWKRLHGFWRTLPNFNPFTASSEPGQNLGAEALAFVQSRGATQGVDDGNSFGSLDGAHISPPATPAGVNGDEEPDANVCFYFIFLVFVLYIQFRMTNRNPLTPASTSKATFLSHLRTVLVVHVA